MRKVGCRFFNFFSFAYLTFKTFRTFIKYNFFIVEKKTYCKKYLNKFANKNWNTWF
jgi:hypothetical protein